MRFVATLILLLLGSCGSDLRYADGRCGPAPAGWFDPMKTWPHLAPGSEVLLASDGTLRWNGQPQSEQGISDYLEQSADLNPPPAIVLIIDDAANCADVRHLRDVLARSEICRKSLCGEVSASMSSDARYPGAGVEDSR